MCAQRTVTPSTVCLSAPWAGGDVESLSYRLQKCFLCCGSVYCGCRVVWFEPLVQSSCVTCAFDWPGGS